MNTAKKYELTNNVVETGGRTLYGIRALKDFADVKAGEFGGLIESEANLSQEGDCWLYSGMAWGNSKIYDDAKVHDCQVCDNAQIYGKPLLYRSFVRGNAKIFGGQIRHATIEGNAQIYDKTEIRGIDGFEEHTRISGDAQIYGHAIIHVFSEISGKAIVHGKSRVFAKVGGHAEITGDAKVMGELYDGKIIGTSYLYY